MYRQCTTQIIITINGEQQTDNKQTLIQTNEYHKSNDRWYQTIWKRAENNKEKKLLQS